MISSSFFRIFPAINLHLSSFIMGVPRFSHTFPGFSPRKAGVRSCRPGPPRGSCIEVRLLPSQLFVSHRRVILPLVNSRVAHGCTKKKTCLDPQSYGNKCATLFRRTDKFSYNRSGRSLPWDPSNTSWRLPCLCLLGLGTIFNTIHSMHLDHQFSC